MDQEPSRPQIFQLDEGSRFLVPNGPAVVGADGIRHEVPPKVFEAMRLVETVLAQGMAVKITPLRDELPIDEAADAIDMARDELRSYVAAGEIPFRSTQYVDWVNLADAIELKKRLKAQTRAALDEMLSEPLWEGDDTDGESSSRSDS